jgi:hypothetical protein
MVGRRQSAGFFLPFFRHTLNPELFMQQAG